MRTSAGRNGNDNLHPARAILPRNRKGGNDRRRCRVTMRNCGHHLRVLRTRQGRGMTRMDERGRRGDRRHPQRPIPLPVRNVHGRKYVPTCGKQRGRSHCYHATGSMLRRHRCPSLFRRFLTRGRMGNGSRQTRRTRRITHGHVIHRIVATLHGSARRHATGARHCTSCLRRHDLFIRRGSECRGSPGKLRKIRSNAKGQDHLASTRRVTRRRPMRSRDSRARRPCPLPPYSQYLLCGPTYCPGYRNDGSAARHSAYRYARPRERRGFRSVRVRPHRSTQYGRARVNFRFLVFRRLHVFPLGRFVALGYFGRGKSGIVTGIGRRRSSRRAGRILTFSAQLHRSLGGTYQRLSRKRKRRSIAVDGRIRT